MTLAVLGVLCVVGCGSIDRRNVYRIARTHVEQEMGEGVRVSSMDDALFAIGKNAARVDVDYQRKGTAPASGYMTVWCKRIRMRWVFERAIDHPADRQTAE